MKIIKLNMHNSKKWVTICPDITWKTLVKVYIYLHYIVDSDLNATFLKTLINWKNFSSLFYKWRCWCVCGLMVSVWSEERSSISSYISDSSERWEIDCFTCLVFHSWLQSFCSHIQPGAILALPSVSNVEWCCTTEIPRSLTFTHEGQDHTSRSASY